MNSDLVFSDFVSVAGEVAEFIIKPICNCGKICEERISRTQTNMNKKFYSCSECNFFEWKDKSKSTSQTTNYDTSFWYNEKFPPIEREYVRKNDFEKEYIIPMYSRKNVEEFKSYCKMRQWRVNELDIESSLNLNCDIVIKKCMFNACSRKCKVISKRKDWRSFPYLIKNTDHLIKSIPKEIIMNMYKIYSSVEQLEKRIDDEDGYWILINNFSDFIKTPIHDQNIDLIVFIDGEDVQIFDQFILSEYIDKDMDTFEKKKFKRGDKYIYVKTSYLKSIKQETI